jgi:hypothetical protein
VIIIGARAQARGADLDTVGSHDQFAAGTTG